MSKYDIVVVGAGHNGLVAATYLARAGRKVLVVERRTEPGGQLAEASFASGDWFPLLHPAAQLRPGIVSDLELEKHGLVRAVAQEPAPFMVVPLDGGGELRLASDPQDEATLESIRQLSRRDAERWPEFVRYMDTAAAFIDAAYATPMPRLPQIDLRRDGLPLGKLALRLRRLGRRDMFRVIRSLSMTAIEFTEEWFEAEPLRGAIGSLAVHGVTIGSMSAGGGYVATHNWLNRGGLAHRPVSASPRNITDALVAAVRAAGGDVRTGAPVERIRVERQRTLGVQLIGGETIDAPTVLSGVDPRHTLLDLVGAPELPPEFVWHTQSIRMRGSVAKVHLLTDGSHGLPATGTIVIAPDLRYLERAYDAAKYGELSQQPYLEVTTHGPVLSLHFQYAPFALRHTDWTQARGALEERAIGTLSQRYPRLRDSIREVRSLTPQDLAQDFALTEGDLNHGQLILNQLLFMRPMPGWSTHRTPVDGLYLCGSGVHGGGGISGAAGRNAAKAVLTAR
jgi:phytoene dehydrogenase-like protein